MPARRNFGLNLAHYIAECPCRHSAHSFDECGGKHALAFADRADFLRLLAILSGGICRALGEGAALPSNRRQVRLAQVRRCARAALS